MSQSKTFCILPWMHLATNASGNLRVCCNSTPGENFIMNNDKPFKIQKDDLEVAWNSPTYKKIRSPGDWDVLQKNVGWFIDNFPSIKRQADFVVQSKNLYELLPFIEEKSKMFDIINLQKITDWNTDNNFKQQAIWKKEHHQYNDFVNLISIASEYPKVRINNLSQYVDKTA